MSSLRTQITLSAVILVALAVALSGLVIAVRIDHHDRAQLDDQLRARAQRVIEDEAKDRASGAGLLGENTGPNRDSTLLAGTDTVTRVLSGTRVVAQRGEGTPNRPTSRPSQAGRPSRSAAARGDRTCDLRPPCRKAGCRCCRASRRSRTASARTDG